MERQIDRIAAAVGEIQDKMGEWLNYSKKAMAKSDANIKVLAETLEERMREILRTSPAVKKLEGGDEGGAMDAKHSELLRRTEEMVNAKLCEFGSLVETEGSNQSQRVQELTLEVRESVPKRVDELGKHVKSLKKAVDAYGQTGLQMVALQKEIQGAVNGMAATERPSKLGETLRSKIDEVEAKILPVLEEVKRAQQGESGGGGAGGTSKKNSDPRVSNQQQTLSDETRLIQVFNALSELKNITSTKNQELKSLISSKDQEIKTLLASKDQEVKTMIASKEQLTSKSLGELKGELRAKFSEVIKNQKYSVKSYQGTEELKKTLAADSKTLSQMSAALKDAKQTRDLASRANETVDQNRAFLEAVRDSQTEITKNLKDLRESVDGEARSSKKTFGTVLGTVEKKLLEALKEQHEVMVEVQKQQQQQQQQQQQPAASTPQVVSRPTRGRGRGRSAHSQASQRIITTSPGDASASASLDELKAELAQQNEKVLGEISKLDTSADLLKQLEELSPRIEHIEKAVAETLPNDFGALNAALEENLCVNLEERIRATQKDALQETFQKFDVMEARLAVIRKYAKHGTQECLQEIKQIKSSGAAPSATVQLNGECPRHEQPRRIVLVKFVVFPIHMHEYIHSSPVGDHLPALIKTELRSLGLPGENDLKRLENSMAGVDAKAAELLSSLAQGREVQEEQFEALADTILNPVTEMRPVLDSVRSDVKDLLTKQASSASPPSGFSSPTADKGKCLSPTALGISPTSFFRMEERHKECLQHLKDLKDVCEGHQAALKKVAISGVGGGGGGGGGTAEEDKNRSLETINTLIGLLHQVEKKQTEGADRSIDYQTSFNTVFTELVTSLESVHHLLLEREGRALVVGELPRLEKDLRQRIAALGELETKLKQQQGTSCSEELPRMVQKCVRYLDSLLKEGVLLEGGGAGPSVGGEGGEQQASPDGQTYHDIYQRFVSTSGGVGGGVGGGSETTDVAKAKAPPVKKRGRLQKRMQQQLQQQQQQQQVAEAEGEPERFSVRSARIAAVTKRGRVSYAESDDEEEEEEDDQKEERKKVREERAGEVEEEEEEEEEQEEEDDDGSVVIAMDEEEKAELKRMQRVRVKVQPLPKRMRTEQKQQQQQQQKRLSAASNEDESATSATSATSAASAPALPKAEKKTSSASSSTPDPIYINKSKKSTL